ncbi:MAG: hypothetical protein IJ775_02810 [Muribaculaceae bacterium]|nr:hypothetical protein [Muribaculaceae bacterium]
MAKIPEIIMIEAKKHGCNHVRYIGTIDGREVFGIGAVDENGNSLPTGLPKCLILKDSEVEYLHGNAVFDLYSRL